MSRGRLGPRRREVLDALRAASAPLGVVEVAERLGVHPNTVRFHLEALVGEGLVEPAALEPSGPGRPRTVYAPRPGMDRGGTRRYRLLAQMLLGRLAAAGAGARSTAVEAGQAWGRALVAASPPSGRPTAEVSSARLVELLDDLGFDPAPAPASAGEEGAAPPRIGLRHCPFLELAEEYGQLVCPLHLALMRGALAGMRAPLTVTDLEPFAEPDLCVAHLAPAPQQPAERHS
ncbi:helix-turn-helix transcriptional regulator [Streptomyces sediminimaris]|uniref:helix-turn-helix transcriptional regulator n=1 Tax=Streptomyces sediminimaris TaxID=3383721 RepID=UPI00399BB92B